VVVINNEDHVEKANALHVQANKMCFIANSCNFPVSHNPKCIVERG
jgi:organic hydroperoxide reductase OsmC/OhrA